MEDQTQKLRDIIDEQIAKAWARPGQSSPESDIGAPGACHSGTSPPPGPINAFDIIIQIAQGRTAPFTDAEAELVHKFMQALPPVLRIQAWGKLTIRATVDMEFHKHCIDKLRAAFEVQNFAEWEI
jgi:hypothetical protein